MVGRVKSVLRGQGTGYIRDDTGRDLFFHKGDVLNKGYNDLEVGVTVRFEIIDDPISGARALQILPVRRRTK
jgi:cold shock CspA family protein